MTAVAVARVGRMERLAQAGLLAGVGVGAAVLRAVPVRSLGLPSCPVHAYLGLDCPGCGATRALSALARGNPMAALDHNVLAMAFLPVLVTAFVLWVVPAARPAWVSRITSSPLTPRLLLAVVLAFTIVRNLPVFGGYLGSA
jgi:hypothetical protein